MSIAVRNLVKRYGETTALRDVSFDVRSGEILGFLGPNGAGKTTTMKIIACFMPPSSGTVTIDDVDIAADTADVRRKIGYLPEMNPLYLEMNVLDYLEYCAQLHGLRGSSAQQRIREMVHTCGLEDVRSKDIGEMSKGYRQRVGLAQAMIHDPEVLILDEPTSGLDPNQIVEIRQLIRKLGQAKTVILSTHILPEVQATCDRVLIINEGSIVADGTPQQLQQQFQGSDALLLELKTPSAHPVEEIAPMLRSIAGVAGVSLDEHAAGISRFRIAVESRADIRESAFRLAVAQGWVVLEMHRIGTSLEEVFHRLTATER
jgi:ABC-2 type transport system ATP-binding protein